MQQTALPLIICAILVIFIAESNDAVTFKLTNMECCSYNQSWFVVNYCRLKVIRRNTIGAYFNASILHPVTEVTVHYQILKRSNGYKPWIMKGKVDVCRFLKRPYDLAAKLIASLFMDFTNFNHTCPYYETLLINGFYLRPELLKLPMPTGDYKLVLGWYLNNKLQLDVNTSFTFVENLMDQ